MSAVPCSPAEAARRAKAWRRAALETDLPLIAVRKCLDRAEEYQAMAVAGGAETGKNADDGSDW